MAAGCRHPRRRPPDLQAAAGVAGLAGRRRAAAGPGPRGAWQDPDAVVSEIDAGDPAAALRGLSAASDPGWLDAWLAADDAAGGALAAALGDELSEPLVAARLGEWLAAEATLFVAASMPIRDVELYLPARREPPPVLSNRGANGIDGTVSAAFGVAAAQAEARWCC